MKMNNKKEYILCAANWVNDEIEHVHQPINIKEGIVICGMRHHNCFYTMDAIGMKSFGTTSKGERKVIQGFLTSKNRFVDREDAVFVALQAKQVKEIKFNETKLFSEDLY